jgi:N6-adenosine-specific RNA methylase IME4
MSAEYSCIAADPPWNETGGCGRGTGNHYPTIKSRADILRVMVTAPCWRPADVAHLWLWTTTTSLLDGLWLMDALGFTYKTFGVWGKVNASGGLIPGMGQYMRHTFEPILFGTRGAARKLSPPGGNTQDWLDTIQEPLRDRRRAHSEKPASWYDRIELVSQHATARLEMFARAPRPGWDVWGNEVAGLPMVGER